jgi:hypothetical protein
MTGKRTTLGFEISTPPIDAIHVVVDEISRPVGELGHAPAPLSDIQEVVTSANYTFAARRHMREMMATGRPIREIIQRMNEPTCFSRITIAAEFAILPPGTALKATNRAQRRTCDSALVLARGGSIEGFELHAGTQERPRWLLLGDAVCDAVEVLDAQEFVPAHLLPEDFQELLKVDR